MGDGAASARRGETAGGVELDVSVVEALRGLPGGRELLALAAAGTEMALVGGAVRDLLLGRTPRELDVVVAREAAQLARALASSLGTLDGSSPTVIAHESFRTASVAWEGGRIDLSERRAESYPAPGALPRVRAGTVAEDLRRRDFTVNAIAVPLGGPRRGEPVAAEHALADLAAGRLRVLHDDSFRDDPTRLLRLARYRARLGFEPEPHTAQLAREALGAGALATVSRARVGAELRLALAEADAVGALASLDELGVLAALDPRLRFDAGLARRALALAPSDGRADLLLLASLLLTLASGPGADDAETDDAERALFELLDGWELTAGERERVTRTALAAPTLARELEPPRPRSALHELLHAQPVEAVALGGALGDAAGGAPAAARLWIDTLRHVRLSIGGEDLLAEGVPAGPEIGRRLDGALARKLDGEIEDGRDAELRAAMDAHA